MDKRSLTNSSNRKFINVKIDSVLYNIENQNILRDMYIEEVLGNRDKNRLLALSVLMYSYHDMDTYSKLKEAKDIGVENIDWEVVAEIIKDIRYVLKDDSSMRHDRNKDIISEFERGVSISELGRQYNLTSSRITQICNDTK